MRTRMIALAVALAALMLVPASASANYHLMKIIEVHEGTGNDGDYIELQMYASGQNLVSGHFIRTYDGGGGVFKEYAIPANVPNGQNQRTILIADAATVQGGVTPDFNTGTGNLLVGTGGSACFVDTLPSNGIDCVTWGGPPSPLTPTGNPSPVGTPAAVSGGIGEGESIVRTIQPNCATLLEAADDSNNSATDFSLGTPSPRPNSVTPTETACPAGGDGPGLELSGKETQKAGKPIKVKASCEEACVVEASGKVKLKGGGGASSAASAKLKDAEADLAADDTATLKLKLAKPKAKKVKRTVKSGGKAKATVEVLATSESGEAEDKLKVKLK